MNKVPVSQLADADKLFLDQAAQIFPGIDLPFVVLDGTAEEINTVINQYAGTPMTNPKLHDWMTHYNGVLLPIVQVACKALADKMAAQPMTMWDRIYATMGLNRQVQFTKLYQKYLAR